ncbi:MAG: DUF938 domain-containing protein [Pseudomonadota bacterium]
MLPLRCSPACERNWQPIGDVLSRWLPPSGRLLEIGSGSGQHASYLIDQLPSWQWQTSDKQPDTRSIMAWREQARDYDRILAPKSLDVGDDLQIASLPADYDAVLTVNTLHIMSWSLAKTFFSVAKTLARANAVLFVYGPMHANGEPTSDSNAAFDHSLRRESALMGIRDIEAIRAAAADAGWLELSHYHMPANNQMLVWECTA